MSSNLDKRIKIKTSLDENAPPNPGRTGRRQFARLQWPPEDRKITLTLDAAARDWLAGKGWDPAYSADWPAGAEPDPYRVVQPRRRNFGEVRNRDRYLHFR